MNESEHTEHSFLSGGGEMGARIRAHDWNKSPLGRPAEWSPGLKTAVRLLLSSGHPMVIWWGPQLIQFYNDAYSRSLGPERHPDALGQPGQECWEEIWDVVEPQVAAVMRGDGYTWHENQLVPITRNGRRENVYWTYSYTPIDDPETATGVGGVLVICVETTAQVLAEQRLAAAEARWRDLFWQAPGFMCILNGPEHVFEFANPSYFDLVGQRTVIGKPIREALPEIVGQGFDALLDDVYQSGKASRHVAQPVTLVSGDGRKNQLYLDFVYQPIHDANGRVIGIFVNGYDVTERVRSSKILLEEDRRKDEFLAMLAHELRNPLAPIRNAGELLLRLPGTSPKIRAIGELITRQTVQLTRLVDDLLDISRITQGRIELRQEPVDLHQVIESAVESVQIQVQKKQHHLQYQPPPKPLNVQGDMARLVQCVANILANAIKFTPPGGRLQVSLMEQGDHAKLEIIDNGVGIPAPVLPRVFDLFVQAEQQLDRSHGGLGIGLSIVKRLVEMHEGRISVHSAGTGQGTTIQILLPLTEVPVAPARPEVSPEPGQMRILVVDDNVDAANSLEQLLALRGHMTAAAYNAHDALSMVDSFAADIVLLDIGLPDIDGYEVARRLRIAASDLRLIAVTGYGQASDIEQAREAGFDAHLTKPVVLSDLEELLGQWS